MTVHESHSLALKELCLKLAPGALCAADHVPVLFYYPMPRDIPLMRSRMKGVPYDPRPSPIACKHGDLAVRSDSPSGDLADYIVNTLKCVLLAHALIAPVSFCYNCRAASAFCISSTFSTLPIRA